MTKDFSRYSHVEVSGMGILPVIKAISGDALCDLLLSRHGLERPEPDQYYSMEAYLSLLHEIEKRMPAVLANAGRIVCSVLEFPKSASLEQVLMFADQTYYAIHRGYEGDDIGHYLFEEGSDGEYFFTVDTPAPCTFDKGNVFGFAEKLKQKIDLSHADQSCRSNGDPYCRYHIQLDP